MAQSDENKKQRSMTLFLFFLIGMSALLSTLTYVGYVHKVFKFGP